MRKENQSHRNENKPQEPNKPNPSIISQEELNYRKKTAIAQIHETIKHAFANEDLSTSLLIAESDIPAARLPQIPDRKIHPFILPGNDLFFGEKRTRPDFQTLYKTVLYKTRMELNNQYCRHHEDIKKSIILPTLCKDNILYCKEGELLHQISLDEKNPRFVTRNILTKKTEVLCEDKMSEILLFWLEEEKAYEIYNKLKPLHQSYTQDKIKPFKLITLPDVQQAYVLNAYRTGFEYQFRMSSKIFDENFLIPTTLCDSKKIISKAGDRYYKIDFNDSIVRFEKRIHGKSYLMSSSEMNSFLNNVYQAELFGTQTGKICAWLKTYYAKEIAPLCQDMSLIPANEVDKRKEHRKKINLDKNFRFITELYKKNHYQNETK